MQNGLPLTPENYSSDVFHDNAASSTYNAETLKIAPQEEIDTLFEKIVKQEFGTSGAETRATKEAVEHSQDATLELLARIAKYQSLKQLVQLGGKSIELVNEDPARAVAKTALEVAERIEEMRAKERLNDLTPLQRQAVMSGDYDYAA